MNTAGTDTTSAKDIREAYEQCRLVTRKSAKNFYYAFLTLPADKRRAIYASYAYCRLCDDIADEDLPTKQKVELFSDTRRRLGLMKAGDADHAVFRALGDAVERYGIPTRYLEEILEGVEMDLTWSRFRTFEELREYCYMVASAVGLVCIEIFGYKDASAREYAVDLGLAMQLTNIIRDVKEDVERDRIYIPLDEMHSFGYSEEELLAGVVNEPFIRLMQAQATRARAHFQRGRRLLPLLSGAARACPAVLHDIYSALLDDIERGGFKVFDGRASLNTRRKLFIMAWSWAKSMLPAPGR